MIEHVVPPRARAAFLAGQHRAGDAYFMALYGPGAALGKATRAYTPDGEVSGSGYVAGGRRCDGWRIGQDDAGAYIEMESTVWPDATLAADGAMVYNATHADKVVVAVLPFGSTVYSTNGPFIVRLDDKLLRF